MSHRVLSGTPVDSSRHKDSAGALCGSAREGGLMVASSDGSCKCSVCNGLVLPDLAGERWCSMCGRDYDHPARPPAPGEMREVSRPGPQTPSYVAEAAPAHLRMAA